MRKLKFRQLSCALLVLAFLGFGCPDSGLICVDVPEVECTDGSTPQVCVSLVDETCGLKIMGEYYGCDCDTIDISCAEDALNACRGGQ